MVKAFKCLEHLIRERDIFGETINIRMGKRSGTFQTIPGGIISLLLFLIMGFIAVEKCIRVARFEEPHITTFKTEARIIRDMRDETIQEMNFIPYMRVSSLILDGPKPDFSEFSRFLVLDIEMPDGQKHQMFECDHEKMGFNQFWLPFLHLCPQPDIF